MKIALCGSTRFRTEFEEANKRLTKHGHVVYSVSAYGHSGDPLTPHEKEVLDLVHYKKILESDAICVIGTKEDGTPYAGDSTRKEVLWAQMNDKEVFLSSDIDDLCSSLFALQSVEDLHSIRMRDAEDSLDYSR